MLNLLLLIVIAISVALLVRWVDDQILFRQRKARAARLEREFFLRRIKKSICDEDLLEGARLIYF